MKHSSTFKTAILLFAWALIFVSCSDSTSSADDEGTPPDALDFNLISESIQPDLSYFEENDPGKQTSYDNYYTGKWTAIGIGQITSVGALYGFMPTLALGEPSRKDGAWVWTFSTDDPIYGGMMPPGQYMAMVLTARDSGDETIWDMTISLSNDEIQIDNYRMIDGRMSKDGNRGSWKFHHMPGASSETGLFMEAKWNRTSDDKVDIETQIYNEGSESNWYTYSQNGNSHVMRAGNPNSTAGDTIIEWNTSTMIGSIQQGSERFCWDSNFQDTACS